MTDPLTTKEPFTGTNFSHRTHPELYEEHAGMFAMSPRKIVAELDRLAKVINKQATVMTEFSEAVLSLTAERDRLREALVHSVTVIQDWHNMDMPQKQRSDLWDIYWRNAPEMKKIRAALEGTK